MSNDLAVKLKQLTSSMKQMSDYLNEKILRLTKPLNYLISENDFKSNGFLNEEIEKLILETDENFNIKRFPKYDGKSDDTSRINRCIKVSNGKTLRIIGGMYDKGSTPNYTEYSGNSGDVKVIGTLGFSNLPDWIVKI